ncbi:MAG: threonine--tRNA ligase [Thermoplasmata archaeon]|nr:MAG: threonine--tRNA ligase [Thermoplasmata archaeon]RLF36006.1 MAG: threonine--tRNA ligase [Thermoplasmata archaeon]
MKILLIHSDYIEYEVKDKAIPHPEEIKNRRDRMEEALTVFAAVEKNDEKAAEKVVFDTAEEIKKTVEQLKIKNIMIYPYAHLSSHLGTARVAKDILCMLEENLKSRGFNVKRAPFGWYKAFKISCKGHPLSELSREITPEEEKKTAEMEKKVESQWYILTPNGDLIEADKFDFSEHKELKILYEYESRGSRLASGEPAHVKMMQALELVDYEQSSDAGNFRWYPKGRLIKGLLERHVSNMCRSIGAMQVETPIMYDLEHKALSAYVKKFPARQYIVRSDYKDFFLRFAACFGQYMIAHDMTISYKNLPLRLYELTHYSFRREQSGEVSGLKRLRAFTMPDLHTLCADIKQAAEEFKKQFKKSMEWMDALQIDHEVALRFVKDFYEKNKKLALELTKLINKPVLVELWDERYFYFVMKFEFNIIDSMQKASALSTVQIDVENAQRFDITFIDEKGEKQYPLILHTSISGSIDRCLYALLEREAIKMKQGEKPMLPIWLSPTQIRFIPVKKEYTKDCKKFVEELNKISPHMCIRADIDDREETVSKKIRDAEKEWIPIIIVTGEKERENKKFTPRFRKNSIGKNNKTYTIKELHDLVTQHTAGFPQEPLPLPSHLSKRPKFR